MLILFLEDLPLPNLSIDNVADGQHQIHLANHLALISQVEEFLSHTQFTSSQPYDLGQNRVLRFVKHCLINVEPIDSEQTEIQVQEILQRYRKARSPIIFPKQL